MSASLAGRVVLVTGASSGAGEATALALAAAGATVVAAARRADRLADLVGRIGSSGGTAEALELDVVNDAQIEHGIDHLRARHGRLDGLVNCAGRMGRGGGIYTDTADWRSSIETNLLGLMLVTRAAVPLMLGNRGATIVNVSSTATRTITVGSAPYGAAKAGVNAFTEGLRKELGPQGIRVTLLLPGLIATEFFETAPDEATKDRYRKWLDAITALQPADIANAIVHVMAEPWYVNINEMMVRPTEQDE